MSNSKCQPNPKADDSEPHKGNLLAFEMEHAHPAYRRTPTRNIGQPP